MRRSIELNENWIFVKHAENVTEAAAVQGEKISLPHTWNAADGQDGGNDYYRGTCWYRCMLERPQLNAGQKVYLEFDGAAMTADVYLNGEKLAHHEGGYSRFRVNVTEKLKVETNELAVSVDNTDNDHVYPQKADFTFYGGLYRMVRMVNVPEVHFSMDYYGGDGIRVTPQVTLADGNREHAQAKITVEIWADGGAEMVTVTAADQTKQAAVADGYAKAEFELSDVHLWDGVKDPYLYTAKAELASGYRHALDAGLSMWIRRKDFS